MKIDNQKESYVSKVSPAFDSEYVQRFYSTWNFDNTRVESEGTYSLAKLAEWVFAEQSTPKETDE